MPWIGAKDSADSWRCHLIKYEERYDLSDFVHMWREQTGAQAIKVDLGFAAPRLGGNHLFPFPRPLHEVKGVKVIRNSVGADTSRGLRDQSTRPQEPGACWVKWRSMLHEPLAPPRDARVRFFSFCKPRSPPRADTGLQTRSGPGAIPGRVGMLDHPATHSQSARRINRD